jgi:hypothetical protein
MPARITVRAGRRIVRTVAVIVTAKRGTILYVAVGIVIAHFVAN